MFGVYEQVDPLRNRPRALHRPGTDYSALHNAVPAKDVLLDVQVRGLGRRTWVDEEWVSVYSSGYYRVGTDALCSWGLLPQERHF